MNFALSIALLLAAAPGPHASHVTIVVMENRNYDTVIGNAQAPYINKQLVPHGVLLTNSHAVSHPSEPNYLALFSGSTHGIASDRCPVVLSAPNSASELIAAGKGFEGLAESMPRDGYTGCYTDLYARKHVPWADFTNVPSGDSRVYHGWPGQVPELVWLVPNLCNDMHDCSTRTGDAWLANNLPPILAWDAAHDGLLILTWDEADPDPGGNHIPTILAGPMIEPGASAQRVTHYSVLRTVETIFGLPCIALECAAPIITGIWQ